MTDTNLEIAGLLLDLSEVYRRNPDFLSELSDREILKIPGVGPASRARSHARPR